MINFLWEAQKKANEKKELDEFIKGNPDSRELKKALAVKMTLEKKPPKEIQNLLNTSRSSVSRWMLAYREKGIEGIRLKYQGLKSQLTEKQRAETIAWLKEKNYYRLEELVNYIDIEYGVQYKSKQSYYSIFKEAGISWKKSQKKNPKKKWS